MRVAVIGTGNMGRHHVRVYKELGANLVAIADISSDAKRIAKKYDCKFYNNFREMIKNEKPDAVSIAVPTSHHYTVAKFCLENGIDVLVEKPITNNLDHAKDLLDISDREDRILMVGHIERFNPAVHAIKNIVDSGDMGDIMSLIARRVGIFPPQIKDASVFIDLGVHDIDIFRYILNREPEKIYALGTKSLINSREDNALIVMDFGDCNGVIHTNWITPIKIRELAITGTKGYAEMDYIHQTVKLYRSNYTKEFYEDYGDFIVTFSKPYIHDVTVDKDEPLKLEIKHFLKCVAEHKKPIVSGYDGYIALKLALIAYKSSKKKEAIEVPKELT